MRLLPQSYYQSEDVLALAQDLLGKIIVSEVDGYRVAARIVETEAYKAPEDKASHAYGNKKTARTATMYEQGGRSYIYLCYGIHHLCNVVTGPKDVAHAVLIRAVEPIQGVDIINDRRQVKGSRYNTANGPGKWTQAMGITTRFNNHTYHDNHSLIRIYDGPSIPSKDVVESARVGVEYAKECALWPWRYYIRDNPWVSAPAIATYPEISTLG